MKGHPALPTNTESAFATMIRHLNHLKRALQNDGITAVVQNKGRTYVVLLVSGLSQPVACRTNPADANHWWYWYGNEPFKPSFDAAAATEAATELKQMRTAPTHQ
jgi:hypothetical protein